MTYRTLTLSLAAAFLLCATPSSFAAKALCGKEVARDHMSSVIGVERIFFDDEVIVVDGERVKGVRGTAWRFDETSIATIEHVATGLNLSPDMWKPITIFWGEDEYAPKEYVFETRAKILWINTDDDVDGGARILLEDAPPDRITIAHVKDAPMKNGDAAVAAGYTEGFLRFATGRLNFPPPNTEAEEDGKPLSYLPFELVDEETKDRLAIDFGGSGSPIFDCEGQVVAIVSIVLTQDLSGAFSAMLNSLKELNDSGIDVQKEIDALTRVPTPWGMYNILATPATDIPRP